MAAIVEELQSAGITDACISPGSRSTAIVTGILRARGIKPWVALDERSAGFFALGMARESGRPVVLACTSGTAAANYLPAVVESSLSQIPLIVLTADRPVEARDNRSAQTIDQVGIFGSHARWSVDVLTPSPGLDLDSYYRTVACRAAAVAAQPPAGPVHLNLPMREPLIDVEEEAAALRIDSNTSSTQGRPPLVRIHPWHPELSRGTVQSIAAQVQKYERGLIVCGPGVGTDAVSTIAALARTLGWPILADPLSGLRYGGHDRTMLVDTYEVLLRDRAFCDSHQPDAIVQFGDPPVSKALGLFLASRRQKFHLMAANPATWPDPQFAVTEAVLIDPRRLCGALLEVLTPSARDSNWMSAWLGASHAVRRALDEALEHEADDVGGLFEGRVLSEVVAMMPEGALLHVGNSMPVRDLDTFAAGANRNVALACNRGANGIDGVLSSAIGAAAVRSRPTVLVLGDLSFLHDIGALQIAANYPVHLLVIVINNDGGGIFSFLPQRALGAPFEPFFATPHGLDFERVASLGRADYRKASSWSAFRESVAAGLANHGLHVLEVAARDRAQNTESHRRCIESALSRLRAESW
jgi:2-succinyl-5-enolpyruvyl-6-hydroxy-3-cyclohexene-1-carboxylate synthase